jgi:DNA repair protein RadA/Sms
LLQISLKLPYKTLYVSGEESQKQIKDAWTHYISGDNCYILTETKTQNIKQIEAIEPEIVIIDSIQTLHTDYIESTPEAYHKFGKQQPNWSNLLKKLTFLSF